MSPPDLIAIDPDDSHAEHVGWTADGQQFFLTTPFEWPLGGKPGCEYVALFLFDADGGLARAQIDRLGPRDEVDPALARAVLSERLASLGAIRTDRIEVRPFSVDAHGTTFGLLWRPPADGAPGAVELMPGNYMAFFAPWDSGVYDT